MLVYLTPFLLCFCNIVVGIFHLVWLPGEVASPFIIFGGASAIFFVFFAKSYEERSLSLLSFFFNNLVIFYVLQIPDPCCFLVGLFLILLTAFHLYLLLDSDVFLDFIFIAVLLSRIFFHQRMGSWGFGLVTELIFLRLYSIFIEFYLKKEYRSGEGSRIEPVFYLIPVFGIALLNLQYLDYGLKEILIHINFLFAAASLIYFAFCSETITELKISFILYILVNLSIGYFLAKSVMTFLQVSSVFLFSNLIFASFFFLKARRSNNPLSYILLSNKREGIQTLLVVYFLVLGVLLTQLNPESAASSLYSNWLFGLGIQIGFLTALNYFFQN